MKFESKKKLREDIEKLEKEKKQLIEKRKTSYDLYKAIIAIMLRENRKYIEIDFRDVLAADDYELAFYDNPFKTTKEIKLIRRSLMTNEQREAIEYLKESALIYKNTIPKIREAIYTVLSVLKEKDAEIEEKDKQIDLIANYIVNLIKYNNPEEISEVEEIKQYFERKSEK